MTSFNSGAQPQNRAPQSIGFLLLDNFTLISLASAVEPLRMANQFRARVVSLDNPECRRQPGVGQRRSANHPRCRHAQSPGPGHRHRVRRRGYPAHRHP
jgi:transcriptional regulator GlxA family with amidase domain